MTAAPRDLDNFPKDGNPTAQELREWAIQLIAGENTMTVATARDGLPWAAPVYYVNREFAFYFFSDPSSRHIQEALGSDQTSAAIFYSKASTWRDIRGVQMSGRIDPLMPGLEAAKAVARYLKKFPFVSEFFHPGQELDLDGFAKRFKVRFYCFRPDLLYYLDNRIRFSFREKVAV